MNSLDDIVKAVRDFNATVEQRVTEARRDPATGEALLDRWREIGHSGYVASLLC